MNEKKFRGILLILVRLSPSTMQVNASSIFVEEEVEYELCRMLDNVKEALSTESFEGRNPEIVKWSTPFYDVKVLSLSFFRSYYTFM